MVFQGKNARELCEQMKDPEKNGHRSPKEIVEHVKDAPIVLEACAWNLVHVLGTLSARRTMLARVERARRTKEGK